MILSYWQKSVFSHLQCQKFMSADKLNIIEKIQDLGRNVLPPNARLILFGSQARGDANADSDWDLLIILDKNEIQYEDFDTYAYPFVALGWKFGEYFSSKLYTMAEWQTRKGTPFYKNIQREGIVLC